MVRSLVMFFGLCLLVPATGCFFEEGGSGGSSGGGGAGMDQCTNDEDMAVVCDAGFDEILATCATEALGQGAETAQCLVDEDLSAECAACYGDETQCVRDNCVGADGGCDSDPTGADCMNCRETHCADAAEECKGEVDCSGGTGGSDGNGGGNGGGGGNAGGGGNGGNDGGGGA